MGKKNQSCPIPWRGLGEKKSLQEYKVRGMCPRGEKRNRKGLRLYKKARGIVIVGSGGGRVREWVRTTKRGLKGTRISKPACCTDGDGAMKRNTYEPEQVSRQEKGQIVAK